MRYLSRRRGLRRFDPVAVGQHETNAWVSYYRHEWLTFLRASVGMVASGFHMSRRDTLAGEYALGIGDLLAGRRRRVIVDMHNADVGAAQIGQARQLAATNVHVEWVEQQFGIRQAAFHHDIQRLA